MTNFDFLSTTPQFATFSDVAIAAEKILHIDPASSVINCRRAMEFAVKWMYSVDGSLVMPWQDNLQSLMNNEDFRGIVGQDIWRRMDLIRKVGNTAAHTGKKITKEQATLCLENLYIFLDFVAYCYADSYTEAKFDPTLLDKHTETLLDHSVQINFEQLLAENAALREELTARREGKQQTYVPKPLDLPEYKTRKLYIDAMLLDAGWTEGSNWINEVELSGMPNKSEVGYADYVLYDDAHQPLALIEAKRTCVDVSKGRQQASLYADILEKKYNRRPVVFLTNGFETRINDGQYPERKVASIYSKRDLEKMFNLRTMRTSLAHVMINKNIAGRYYQEGAVKAVCDSFDRRNRRKALLVMATGSGKTRTIISLCDVLLRHGWVKNILFLADRTSLVTQAKRSFVNLLPDLSVTNLCEEKDNYSAHCVFSTYQTMMNCIDAVKDEQGKLFTSGHFDLVICDEAHRSIYNKYQDIFTYFDAPLVGLTATPKDEVEKNTYDVFELENGVPTYGYELAQAVKDGYLVDFMSVETRLKFIEQGIVYDELSEEDRQAFEETFADESGEVPESISSSALNEWIFNEDTIREVLHILMTNGLKINYGEKIGKTIIFAKNHRHAEKILEIFGKEYPHLNGYAKVIDNKINYAQSAIDVYTTNFADEILSMEWNESELENDDLKNYKARAEFYVRNHQDHLVIAKLKKNVPLTQKDISVLEEILWSEVGTKQDYEAEYGQKPLGEFVREIVGLDMNAAKEAFSEYLSDTDLDSRQIYFVNQIVEYIVHNGVLKDMSVLQESPFTDRGSVVEIFTDMSVWMGIRSVIDRINGNAVVA